jgi:orotate phosphoribosyltransferase
MSTSQKLVEWLFETKAVRVCPENKPFWYTSGTIGPYYVNTHFLYGSEQKANELLALIDREKENKITCPDIVLGAARRNYSADAIYRGLMDAMGSYIREKIDLSQVDYISGGERRDWFFSLLLAEMLNKPHITIYKDLSIVLTKDGITDEVSKLEGSRVLHIADLITEASSYERAWIPAIRHLGAKIIWSVVVVDRLQGGGELLARFGIQSHSMVNIDTALFENAARLGLISTEQFAMLKAYIASPKDSMRDFLISHPEFLQKALSAEEKTRERALLCLEKKIYEMP